MRLECEIPYNIDVVLYDIGQCFDSLWLHETLNDLYDNGVQNRNLNLLFAGNSKTLMSVKTPFGSTPRVELHDLVMQGSIPGPLLCSNQLAKNSNDRYNEGSVYMYKNCVPIPPLCMVDDIATINLCDSVQGVELNSKCDTFVKCKKLEFQVKKGKCQYVHIGSDECSSRYSVDNKLLLETDKAKYLADMISNDSDVLFKSRLDLAMGYATQCLAILTEISLGHGFYSTAKLLHQSIFLSGSMTNVETWPQFTDSRVCAFERVQQYFIRRVFQAHSKTPIECLYLELGVIPFRYTIMKKRIMYFKVISERDDSELTKKVILAQVRSPLSGDFMYQVKASMSALSISHSEIMMQSKDELRGLIDKRINSIAYDYLIQLGQNHSKVNTDLYSNLEGSDFLFDNRFSTELCNILFKFRTRMYTVKGNYRNKYASSDDMECPLENCLELDTQEHMFSCKALKCDSKSVYTDIFSSDMDILLQAGKTLLKLVEIREDLLENKETLN